MLNFLKPKFFLKKFNIYLTTKFFKLVYYFMFPPATYKYSNGFKSLPTFGNVRIFKFLLNYSKVYELVPHSASTFHFTGDHCY